jgi:hypothetical protein
MPEHTDVTWEQLVNALAESYPTAVADGARALRLVLTTSGPREVRVGLRVRATTAYGEAVVVITADLGAGDALDPLVALATNSILAHGSLALTDGVLELRAVVPLAGLTDRRFELTFRKLAAEAAELKARLAIPNTATVATSGAFSYLAD